MVIANRTFHVSPSSFIYPPVPPDVPIVVVFLCPGRHLCPGIPVYNFSLTLPVVILYSLCPGCHLCPGVPVCNFSWSVPVVIYIPCVPVVICVPVSRSVVSSYNNVIYKALYTYNDVTCKPKNKQTCIYTTYLYIHRYSFVFIFFYFLVFS